MNAPRTIGSLFSGIGGLELGLERALGAEVLWQCEIDVFCRRVLRKHWPRAALYRDVRALGVFDHPEPVDLICGGFPCQDISPAGKGAGLAGARSGLWRECARVVDIVGPEWVVVENSGGGATRWVDAVVGELERLGYAPLPIPLAACDVGAPHERARVFIVAHAYGERLRQHEQRNARRRNQVRYSGQGLAVDAVAQRAAIANADGQGELCKRGPWHEGRRRAGDGPGEAWAPGTFEPDFLRVAYGVSDRLDRVGALGNAVVPPCAEVIGEVINRLCEGN